MGGLWEEKLRRWRDNSSGSRGEEEMGWWKESVGWERAGEDKLGGEPFSQ